MCTFQEDASVESSDSDGSGDDEPSKPVIQIEFAVGDVDQELAGRVFRVT